MRLIDADELKQQFVDKLVRVGLSPEKAEEFAKTAFDAIFKTIDAMPTIEAVPLEDYRSMEQTVHKLTQALAEAEPKHGRWLPSDKGDCTYICSECGFVRDAYVLEEKAFCPHCGAKMDEPEAAEIINDGTYGAGEED